MKKRLALIVVGGAIWGLSCWGIVMNMKGHPFQPSEFRTPVIESPLYLNEDYEEERAKLFAIEDEYTKSLALWNERRQGKEWQLPFFLITGFIGAGVFFSGVENRRYLTRKNYKTNGIITKVPYTHNVKRD
jgi:hypothetical protein